MKTEPRKRRRTTGTARSGAASIVAAARELDAAIETGKLREIYSVREVTVTEPAEYSAAAVRRLRGELGVSQAVFAKLIGVSKELVEHWEQSVATPRPLARRLLDEIRRDPRAFAQRMLVGAA